MSKQVKYLFYFFISCVIVLGSQLLLKDLPNQIPDIKRLLVSILALLIFWLLFYIFSKKNVVNIGILIILVFGIAACLIKPVQIGLDEDAHLKRTLELTTSGVVKKEEYKLAEYDKIFEFDFFRNRDVFFSNHSFFEATHETNEAKGKSLFINNIAYLPSAIGWKIGEIISSRIFISYYLGRIFNVIAFAILVYLSMKICSKIKNIIFLFSAFPPFIYTVAGYHYDSIYFGLSLIIFSLVCKYFYSDDKVSLTDVSIFLLSSCLMAFVKIPYILLGLLVLFIPKKRLRGVKDRLIIYFGFLIQFTFSILYYLNFNSGIAQSDVSTPSIFYFVKHPLPIIRTILDLPDVIEFNLRYTQIFAKTYSTTAMMMSEICFVLCFLIVSNRFKNTFNNKFRILFSIFSLMIIGATVYAITTDPRVYQIGMTYIPGVQGRYFYFILLFLPMYTSNFTKKLFNFDVNDEATYELAADSFEQRFLVNSLILLNILNLGISMYTMIPY